MTDEEKIAIHRIESRANEIKECLDKGFYYGERFRIKKELEDIYTALNLIKKQQKEIELAKKSLIENANVADERNQLLVENQKKDKIIQAMAEKISEYKDYLEGIPEDDMWHEECFLYNKISDCNAYNGCADCIKEYFTKKVEGE